MQIHLFLCHIQYCDMYTSAHEAGKVEKVRHDTTNIYIYAMEVHHSWHTAHHYIHNILNILALWLNYNEIQYTSYHQLTVCSLISRQSEKQIQVSN